MRRNILQDWAISASKTLQDLQFNNNKINRKKPSNLSLNAIFNFLNTHLPETRQDQIIRHEPSFMW